MGFYGDEVLPRITNVLLANPEFRKIRQRVAAGLSGQVLEVGFGSGLNVPFYPGEVKRVLAVEPAAAGRKLAAKRVAQSMVPVDYVGLDGASLPLESESVDHVLITWTMCTIPDVEDALSEMRRVLRSGGQMHFVEHGRSPDPKVARRQDQLNPVQRWWAGGCNLNRPIERLVTDAGFETTVLENFYMRGPKFTSYMYEGVATKS
ncbi:MAG TPA: methyltransferase domain-containing protein [Acidimicrobiales bacterium]|nr:methyltransferase domain-containing protein [Acidimicrobiales bacterium]